MSRKRWIALIGVAMLLVASIIVNFRAIGLKNTNDLFAMESWDEVIVDVGEDIGGEIAVLQLNGVIQDDGGGLFGGAYNHQLFLQQLDYAAESPYVAGIIIRVNTPGGGVIESADIYERIVRAQEQFSKPVFVTMEGMAASGGYYIAAPADKIIANPQTITGSIGVIMESINVAGLAEKYGIEINTIKSGPYKDIMSATREMTEEERAILQSLIDESYDEFVRIIVEGRGMSEQEVRQIADGRIYSGKQAYELNLVDELGSFSDSIQWMREEIGADYDVVSYEETLGFSQLFSMSMKQMLSNKRGGELEVLERFLAEDHSPALKYLYTE